ncbi:hypothetical protein G4Y79_13295 [Phototrophicus methaneseepsis]|uniref:WD40 repeat domain-containing protein n=1 Tax=Phototrophicus methaneseepsis TaxID=2710758 RepID=A0A7S8E5D1_9CHLR|nr:hypothetical protein [Phototrophicus methaneseepsis]QPC80687.1 hypothetical protein G4Y79_13295 [Phototrophicus methaneseepsis]
MRRLMLLILLLMLTMPILAQEDTPPVITSDNVAQLQSVQQIDFDDLAYQLNAGWFAMNWSGTRFALRDATGHGVVFDETGESIMTYPDLVDDDTEENNSPQVVDAVFFRDAVYFLSYDVSGVYVNGQPLDELAGIPLAIGSNATDTDSGLIVVEIIDVETQTNVVYEYEVSPSTGDLIYTDRSAISLSSETGNVVRIGRISIPKVVTSTVTGLVSFGIVGQKSVQVGNGTGQPSVFGNINADATHLVWRDNASQTLYLLDFETGENRIVAPLNGAYAQWFFLSNDASTILAVNLDHEPIVVAWDVETGEKTVLGEYRQCNRPQPDMARLSTDGTTLVIGCDTGLDVWRVVDHDDNEAD